MLGPTRFTARSCGPVFVRDVYGSTDGYGINLVGSEAVVSGNTVYDNTSYSSVGIVVQGPRALVTGNDVYGNVTGIWASTNYEAGDRSTVRGNRVHHNTSTGILGTINVLIEENTVWHHLADQAMGILVYLGTVRDNEVFDNSRGIVHNGYYGPSVIEGNRVYHNTQAGISAQTDSAVEGNVAYANSVGIEAVRGPWDAPFTGRIANNLVYANTNQGIRLDHGDAAELVNNTVYQPVGDAVRIEGTSTGTRLRNNILWVRAGYDIYVAADSRTGFDSDYNLFHQSSDPNAHAGFWNEATADSLADWRDALLADPEAVGQKELLSREGNPNFVDIDGSDNVLGYTTDGGGYDGGRDDNFSLAAHSPAIDCAEAWSAPLADILGAGRYDDPGSANRGSPVYVETIVSGEFAAAGEPMNWRSDGT